MRKTQELRGNSPEELEKKVLDLEEELFNLRFQAKMGQLANALQLRMVRRAIGRTKTILAEKKAEAAATAATK
jgi:large subunit ribosomal protein L29